MLKPKRIYEYLGDCDPLLNARASSRCGQTVTPCGEGGGTGGDPPIVPTFEIGTPVVIPFSQQITHADCQVLDESRYLVVGVTSSGTAALSRNIVCSVVNVDVGSAAIESIIPEQVLENTLRLWDYVRLCKVSSNRIIIFMHTTSPKNVYGLICDITGNTVTPVGAPTLISTLNSNSIKIDALPVLSRDNLAILMYLSDAGANPRGRMSSIDASGTVPVIVDTQTVNSGTFNVMQSFGLCDGPYEDLYRCVYNADSSVSPTGIVSAPVFVFPDNTLSVDSPPSAVFSTLESIGLNGYGTAIPLPSSNFIYLASKATGATIRVSSYLNATIASIGSLNTVLNTSLTLASVGGDRVFYIYGHSGGVGLEMYTFNGSALNRVFSTAVDAVVSVPQTDRIRLSSKGLTDTKTPIVYIGQTLADGFRAYTFVGEAGA